MCSVGSRIFAAALLALSLSACGPAGVSPGSDKPPEEAAAPVSIPKAPKLTQADLPAPYSTADLAAGEASFNACRNCHETDPAKGNTIGPNLHGVFDRAAGGLPDYRYSDALKAHANTVTTWTPEELDKWIASPAGYLPGSSMFFNGLTDPKARENLIAYLLIATS